jgi:biotin transport system substrate-specific component
MSQKTFAQYVWPVAEDENFGRYAFLILAALIFIVLCGQITLPVLSTTVTMQSFAALVIGLVYGPRLSATTLVLFCLLSLAGVPGFSNGGIAQLIGCLAGGVAAGFVIEGRATKKLLPDLAAGCAGVAAMLAVKCATSATAFNAQDATLAFASSALPLFQSFEPADLIMALLAAFCVWSITFTYSRMGGREP